MSRNVRKNIQTPAVKAASKRRDSTTSSSSLDLSGEEGYSDLDDVPDDDDDDEEDVDAAEEDNIITQSRSSPAVTTRPYMSPLEEDDDDDDDEDDDDVYNNDDNEFPGMNLDDSHTESPEWAGIVSDQDDGRTSDFFTEATFQDADYGTTGKVDRHVRFNLPDAPPSESDSTESDDFDYRGLYEDIFVEQHYMDPGFRRLVEVDPEESSGSGSCWDYDDQAESEAESPDDLVIATPRTNTTSALGSALIEPSCDPEPSDLDGYETEGESTDEDEDGPYPPVRPKIRRSLSPASDDGEAGSDVGGSPRQQRGQPRVGRYRLDKCKKKPTVVFNTTTKKLTIFTPNHRHHLELSPEQFQGIPFFPDASPMLSNSGNVMIGATSMFHNSPFADLLNGQAVGGPELFFAGFNGADDSEESMGSHPSPSNEEDDGERNLDLNDFIAFEDSSSSEDEDDKDKRDWAPSSTPARPTTASSDVEMLSHLNSHTVTAFRRNQVNQQLILSNQATQDSLAFSGPYNHTAIRGIRSDRFDTAGVPLTPARRRKSQLGDVGRSPLETVSAKRKATGDAQYGGHKKHRSISDMNQLHI